MKDGEQKRASVCGSGRVLNSSCQNENVASLKRIVAVECLEEELTIEDVYGDWAAGAVSWQIAAGSKRHDRKPKGAFLDESASAASVPGNELFVDQSFVGRQMGDENFTVYGSMH